MQHKIINITGNAKNIDGHAALVADKVGVYFVEGLDEWNKDWLEKKVKIIGDLAFLKNKNIKVIKKPVLQLL